MNSITESYIDIPLSLTKVARIVEENSPLRVKVARKLGEGLEYQSFLVNDSWVFRFPKQVSEMRDPITEKKFSQNLKLSVSIPEIKYIWNNPWGYPETISGYKYLPGTSLEHFRASEIDQVDLANRIGLVLTDLHKMTGCDHFSLSDPLASLRTWYEDMDEQLSRVTENVLMHNQLMVIKSYLEQYRFDLPSTESVLIHGDLGADHILLNEQKFLSGIIDWSSHTNGNRYRDFVGLWRWGGDSFCTRVLGHYPVEPRGTELAYVRVMGLVSCIAREILLSEQQDERLRTHSRALLEDRLSEISDKSPYDSLRD